jgi:copper resistance protein D
VSDQLISIGFIALDMFAVAVLTGIAAAGGWLLTRLDDHRRINTGCVRLLGMAIIVLLITSVAILIMRTAVMADVPPLQTSPFIIKVITHSDFGVIWITRMLTLCALAVLLFLMRHRATPLHFLLIAACALVIAFLISSTTHAAGDGLITFANAVNWLHITFGCLWGGTVVAYAVIVLPQLLRGAEPQAPVAQTAMRLSTLAGIALLIVVITGVLNAWRQIPMLSDLWTSKYGLVLSGKVAVVGIMAAIGAFNRFYIVPVVVSWASATASASHTQDSNPPRRFLGILRIDSVIFGIIIICAAILSMQEPPFHDDVAHSPSHNIHHSHDTPG